MTRMMSSIATKAKMKGPQKKAEHAFSQVKDKAPKPRPENLEDSTVPEPEWKAGKDIWLVIIVIAVVSLMVALDATILVPVLPVSTPNSTL